MPTKAFLFGTMNFFFHSATKSETILLVIFRFDISLCFTLTLKLKKKLAHLIVVICKRKSFITSCLDETTVQMKKRRKRRRRKSSFTHSQISFESFNSQRIRERIRRRNYLKKGNLSPRRVVEISGQPISNWKKDDLLGLYDLVDCDRTGRPVYKVKCLLLSTL